MIVRASRLDRGYPGGSFGVGVRHTPKAVSELGVDIHVASSWPIAARASSSYESRSWNASRVPGRPDVWPRSGDIADAWAPRRSTSPAEWLEADFDPGPLVELVRVFETNAAGAAYAVAIDAGDGFEVVWLRSPGPLDAAARVLEVRLPEPRFVRRVRVWVDASSVIGFPEIDTVALFAGAPLAGHVELDLPIASGHHLGYSGEQIGRATRYGVKDALTIDPLVASRGSWPVSATASSEFSSSWCAAAIVGRPRVWPKSGDLVGAWAPGRLRSAVEWIEATFVSQGMPVRAIRVFETHRAGSTYAVSIFDGPFERVVWQDAPIPRVADARLLEVDLDELTNVDRVRVYVDNSASGWTEIDSISLLPVPRVDAYRVAPVGAPYRGSPIAPFGERLAAGFDGNVIGKGDRYGFFEMLARDWRFHWRAHWPTSAPASTSFGGAGVEWLEVVFEAPGHDTSAVRVFETEGAGATFALTIETDELTELVWQAAPVRISGARVLEVDLGAVRRVRRVRVWVDHRVSKRGSQIDAIRIDAIGLVPLRDLP